MADAIGTPSQKRVTASAVARDLSTADRVRLDSLLSRAEAEITALGLQPDRVSELASELAPYRDLQFKDVA